MPYPLASHLRVKRPGYWHHGIYVGHRVVVHFTDLREGKAAGKIRTGTLTEFAAGTAIEVVHYDKCDDVETVLRRAQMRLEDTGYNVDDNNCEHFATWCKTGKHHSKQAKTGRYVVGGFIAAAAAGGGAVLRDVWKSPKPPRCKGTVQKTGKRCMNPPRVGNYGFCGLHRK